jgi:hypothetical protein
LPLAVEQNETLFVGAISFDEGGYRPGHQQRLGLQLGKLTLPKKERSSIRDSEISGWVREMDSQRPGGTPDRASTAAAALIGIHLKPASAIERQSSCPAAGQTGHAKDGVPGEAEVLFQVHGPNAGRRRVVGSRVHLRAGVGTVATKDTSSFGEVEIGGCGPGMAARVHADN